MTAAPADDAPAAEGKRGDTRSVLARGSFWTVVQYGGSQLLRLVSNAVLWRLLVGDAFGLMILVNGIVVGLSMFSEMGVGPAIVQNARGDDRDFLNTAWTIQIVRGLGIFVVGSALALPFALFYGRPELTPLVPVVAASALVSGCNSTKLFTATRQIALGRMTIVELGAQAVGLILMVGIALVWPTVWALAWGSLVGAIVRCVATHVFLPGPLNRLRWDRSALHDLVGFGRWMFASTMLTFLALNADKFIFAKVITMEELAVFGVAATFASLPAFILGHTISQVLFPLMSRAKGDGTPLRPFFLDVRRPMLVTAAWMATCLIAGGPALIHLIYPPKAEAASWIIQVLAVASFCAALENANSHAMLALGHPKWLAAANGAKVVAMVVLIPIGSHWGGFWGAIVAVTLADVAKYVVSAVAVARAKLTAVGQDVKIGAALLAIAAAGVATRWAVTRGGLQSVFEGWGASDVVAYKLAAFLEGAAVFVVVSSAWGALYLRLRKARAAAGTVTPAAAA